MTRTRIVYTGDIDEHVAKIRYQVDKSLADGETRQLAVKIVSDAWTWRRNPRTGQEEPYVEAWGRYFRVRNSPPCVPRDEQCEVTKIWDFVVTNCRYVYDPVNIDTFATVRESLIAGGGDCDDSTIMFDALLGAIGFPMGARVISTAQTPDDWEHIYALVGMNTKDKPTVWVPLDPTVDGAVPGWEYDNIGRARDYLMTPSEV